MQCNCLQVGVELDLQIPGNLWQPHAGNLNYQQLTSVPDCYSTCTVQRAKTVWHKGYVGISSTTKHSQQPQVRLYDLDECKHSQQQYVN